MTLDRMGFRLPSQREWGPVRESRMRIRVLLLEADGIRRRMILETLRADPRLDVLEAAGPRHALALCESELPGIRLVLLDMDHPGMDAAGLILALRGANPLLAILGLAGHPGALSDPRLKMTRAGYVLNPVDPHHLHRSIQILLTLESLAPRRPVMAGKVARPYAP